MKPQLQVESNPEVESLRQQAQVCVASMGETVVSDLLTRRTIKTTETRIAHDFNGTPRWSLFDKEGAGDVWQTKRPDAKFLYLIASVEVVTGIVVF